MSNNSSKKNKKGSKEINVLYQNLGGKLYAFTEINGQVFFGKVPVQQSTKDSIKQPRKTKDSNSKDA